MSTTMKPFHTIDTRVAEARFALRVCARLSEGSAELPNDVSEHLRMARQQALQRAQAVRMSATTGTLQVQGLRTALGLSAGGPSTSPGWLSKMAATLPFIVLVAGLFLIQKHHLRSQVSAAAEIDTALLSDDVPPNAYSDEGFVEFLKTPPL